MKKSILLALTALMMLGCEHKTDTEIEEAERLKGFNIVVIDSCEYLEKDETFGYQGYGFKITMAYLTKDKSGLIQLWNNRPELNKDKDVWLAWIDKVNDKNEIGIDVTSNDYFRHLFDVHKTPCCIDIELKCTYLIN